MKINIVLPSFPIQMTGGFKIIFEYANALAANGHDIALYFVIQLPHDRPHRPTIYLYLKSLWLKKRRPSWFTLDSSIRTQSILRLNKNSIRDADALLCTNCLVALELKNLPPCKGTTFNLIQDYEDWILPQNDLLNESFRTAAHNIVIADYLVPLVENVTKKRPHVLYNAYRPEQFHITTPIAGRQPHRVAMLWHEMPKKGCNYGIEALRICRERFPDLEVELFGIYSNPNFDERWIHYTQQPDNLCALYNSVAIFLTPSLNEGWGLTATEAMACGCALVCTDTDGLRVFAHEGKTALLAPPADAEALANRLCELLVNNTLRQQIAQSGSEYIQRFTWKRAVTQLEQILKNRN